MSSPREELEQRIIDGMTGTGLIAPGIADHAAAEIMKLLLADDEGFMLLGGKVHEILGAQWEKYLLASGTRVFAVSFHVRER